MPKDVKIRAIQESDVQNIHAVALEAWQSTYRAIFDRPFIENFVHRLH
jgi:hypothetical protein